MDASVQQTKTASQLRYAANPEPARVRQRRYYDKHRDEHLKKLAEKREAARQEEGREKYQRKKPLKPRTLQTISSGPAPSSVR